MIGELFLLMFMLNMNNGSLFMVTLYQFIVYGYSIPVCRKLLLVSFHLQH